jgi:hypothetical protein
LGTFAGSMGASRPASFRAWAYCPETKATSIPEVGRQRSASAMISSFVAWLLIVSGTPMAASTWSARSSG